ncbi:MAG TPA: class D sortase [Steroidobacter sp.]
MIGGFVLHLVQRVLLGGGLAMMLLSVATLAAGELGRRADIESFSAESVEGEWQTQTPPDMSLWSARRVRDFKLAQAENLAMPLAVLRVPTLGLSVPVYPNTTEVHLNRGVGVIEGMAMPDRGGNLGLAGHRDGFFRVLKDIAPGTVIEIQTRRRMHRYRVSSIDIVDKTDGRLLVDTDDPTITLVTCYPFYFVGDAPRRFVVRGVYLWPAVADPAST